MQYGCIGEHLPHSFSKIIHNMIADYSYELCELAKEEVGAFMQKKDFLAINVTIPYKETVIPYLDFISEEAKSVGAVNTVVNKNGILYGYNTDVFGMTKLIKRAGIEIENKTVLILGTGGTAKTAYAVAKALGAGEIRKVSRKASDAAISYEAAYGMADRVDVIINTTPCGMFPHVSGKAIELAPFTKLSGVVDAVYNPLRTDLILEAQEQNVPCASGLYMLVAQAVAASEIFTDTKYPENMTDKIFADVMKEKENVVLTGMPSSGKTTVGKHLADKLSKSFTDTDDEIEKATGKAPAEIIRTLGISEFRRIESEVISSLAPQSGTVIATGGGAVLNAENVKNLKKNGKLVFLDRPLEKLVTTSDRPLSSDREKLCALYKERLPVYTSAADAIIDASAGVEETAERVMNAL